ncbi:hypothetical protein [Lyngbya aestuarii]|uniref:hypothetical protein n=1 Tax=Lyngbya aestuarii TaxID=118322 RepID=UPI00403DC3E2
MAPFDQRKVRLEATAYLRDKPLPTIQERARAVLSLASSRINSDNLLKRLYTI